MDRPDNDMGAPRCVLQGRANANPDGGFGQMPELRALRVYSIERLNQIDDRERGRLMESFRYETVASWWRRLPVRPTFPFEHQD